MPQDTISECEKSIGYVFKDKNLLETALTHTSYANEHKTESYQRLEFLGDSVVSIVISKYIYKKYTSLPEGDLTKFRACLVCEETFAKLSLGLSIDKYMRLGVGEIQQGGREKPSILADIFESITGAVYLDGGFECAEEYVLRHMKGLPEEMVKTYNSSDHKTNLQEFVEKKGGILTYEIIGEEGPDHNKSFTARASALGLSAEGKGRRKKDAEQEAAKNFLLFEAPKC